MDKLKVEHKAALIVLSFVVCIIAGTLIIYLENLFWVFFCIGNIIGWGIFGLFLFITFLVKFIEFRTNPELTKEKIELELRIKEYEKEIKRIKQNEL